MTLIKATVLFTLNQAYATDSVMGWWLVNNHVCHSQKFHPLVKARAANLSLYILCHIPILLCHRVLDVPVLEFQCEVNVSKFLFIWLSINTNCITKHIFSVLFWRYYYHWMKISEISVASLLISHYLFKIYQLYKLLDLFFSVLYAFPIVYWQFYINNKVPV